MTYDLWMGTLNHIVLNSLIRHGHRRNGPYRVVMTTAKAVQPTIRAIR